MWGYLALFSLLCSTALCLDPRWKLLWADEFSGSQLDETKWTARNFRGNPSIEYQWYLPEQVSVSNGTLQIRTEINYRNTTQSQNVAQAYLSGWIDSVGKFASTYGRYEMSAKFPVGIGWWPAFWMLSEDLCWPVGAEFDIIEFRGYQNFTAWGTYHFGTACGGDLHNGSSTTSTSDLSKGYHTYAVEWFPGNATWYLDDKPYTVLRNTSLNKGAAWLMDITPHFLILNNAIGTFSIPVNGKIDNSTFPQTYYVDYVRAYAWDPCTGGCGHGCCDPIASVCVCDGGYKGVNCEYSSAPLDATGKYVADFSQGTFANNAVIVDGVVTLTANLSGCPNGTGNCVVPSWKAPGTYDKGNFTFVAKNTNVKGFAFAFMGMHSASNGIYEGIQANMIAANPIKWSAAWFNAVAPSSVYINNSFDPSKDFHTYTILWESDSISIYVDGVYQNTVPGAPTSPIIVSFTLTGSSAYYGQINGSQVPTSAYVKYFSWTPLKGKADCSGKITTTTTTAKPATATTTSSAAATTSAATTTAKGTTAATSATNGVAGTTSTSGTTGTAASTTATTIVSPSTSANPSTASNSATTGKPSTSTGKQLAPVLSALLLATLLVIY